MSTLAGVFPSPVFRDRVAADRIDAMSIHRHSFDTSEAFLRWNEGREGKRELVDGEVIEMMTGGSKRHARLMLDLAFFLSNGLRHSDFVVTAADYAVRTAFGIRYPDVLVSPGKEAGDSLASSEALLIAEILSPSSLAIDFGEKAAEYTAIDSLAHYLVLSQDEPRVWLWSRGEDGAFEKPTMIAGRDETLHLPALGLDLPLADLYRGIA